MPAEMTNSFDTIKKCFESSESDCLGECNWFKGTADKPADSSTDKPADTTTPSGPRPLFTEEFCHPITINKDTTEDVFSQCVDKQSATECDNAVCKWSNGKDLIPERDFCAPKDMTKKLDEILGCIGKDSATTCDGICEWRRGV